MIVTLMIGLLCARHCAKHVAQINSFSSTLTFPDAKGSSLNYFSSVCFLTPIVKPVRHGNMGLLLQVDNVKNTSISPEFRVVHTKYNK